VRRLLADPSPYCVPLSEKRRVVCPLYWPQSDSDCRTARTPAPFREGEQSRRVRQTPGCHTGSCRGGLTSRQL